MISNPIWITAAIFFIVSAGFYLAQIKWISKLSPALVIMLLGGILSNSGILPVKSQVYDIITGPVTSLSIIFLLLSFDLSSLKKIGYGILLLFFIAVLGSCLGGFIGGIVFKDYLPDAWKLSGALTGTYTGGSLNFVAVARELKIESSIFSATTAADNITTALWMGVNILLPIWLAPLYQNKGEYSGMEPVMEKTSTQFDIKNILSLFALGLLILIFANWLYDTFKLFPRILWLTSLALIIAQVPFFKRWQGSFELGNLGLHLFFAVIGIGSNIHEVIKIGPVVFYFTLTVVLIHGFCIYFFAWLFKMDLPSTSVASQAAIGGPTTAMAIAVARWPRLTLPAMIVGLLGYAVGNYAGILVARVVFTLFY